MTGPLRGLIDRVQRALPVGLTADELALHLVGALAGEGATGAEVTAIATRLRVDPHAVPAVVAELLALPATAARHALPLLGRLEAPDPGATLISLGSHCFTASLLQRWGIRRWAGPFDWLFSSVAMVTHCLDDDFRAFLDRGHYEPVPLAERAHGPEANRVHHRLYREMFGIEHVFNHHDVHLDAVHARYVRRVQRFRDCLASEEPKVFVIARVLHTGATGDLADLRDALARRGRRFRLLAFEVPYGGPQAGCPPTLTQTLTDDALEAYTLAPSSDWGPLRFQSVIDEHVVVHRILSAAQRFGAHHRSACLQ